MLSSDVLGIFRGEKALNASDTNGLNSLEYDYPLKDAFIICILLKGCGY